MELQNNGSEPHAGDALSSELPPILAGASLLNVSITQPDTLGDSIFNSIRDAILVLNRDGTIERVNPATVSQTGYAEHELVGKPVSILSGGRKYFAKIFDRALARDILAERIETHCVRKDGTRFAVSLSAARVFDPLTGSDRIVCVARDIAKRKRLEAESRAISRIIHGVTTTANLEEFLDLVHSSIKRIVYAENFFVALIDPETDMLTMQFWVDKYDPMPAPLKIGRSLSAYVFRRGETMLLSSADVKRLIETGEVESVGTDSPIWLGVPLTTPSGPIGVLVVQDYENSDTYSSRDMELLTSVADQIAIAIERKRNEEALRQSNERFQLVTRATSDAVWDWNLETDAIWWNEGFGKLFGYLPEEVGATVDAWQERLHPEDEDRVTEDIHRHIAEGKTNWASEYRFRRRDGSYAHVIDRGYVVYNDEGRPVRMLGSMMDVTDRKRLEDQLTHQALHDPLTKIANRALFRDRVDHALKRLSRNSISLAVLFLDLDNFKSINDTMGHAAGDRLLVAVAERLQDCLRSTDTAARLGGDEFAILIESVHRMDEAVMIAERILEVFKQPFDIGGKEIYVGTSIGIATASDEEANAEAMLRNADLAMYLAKSDGKGRYVIFEPKMHEALVERVELEADLRRGIEENEFIIHYQPIFDLGSSRVTGMEALVRWQHPRLGLVPPMKFIPLAEETGLIVPLGEWVIVEACKQIQKWRMEFQAMEDLSVTVNISIRQFHQRDLVHTVRRALGESGLRPASLILEITESFMMEDAETTIEKLEQLKALGVRLAIDDFGTGYSSLSYLQRFPVDILKIDKSFIDKLGVGSEGNAVAKAIIMMGDSLNLRTIAEGIEHDHQITELKGLGCESGQGFHFARPLPSDAVHDFLKAESELYE